MKSDKDRLATVQAMLAGYQLSAWLPGGWRNIIMLVIVVFAVLGGVLVHWYWGSRLTWAVAQKAGSPDEKGCLRTMGE